MLCLGILLQAWVLPQIYKVIIINSGKKHMTKKICILQNGLARGGTDAFVVNLCRGIDKTRYEITVVNPSNHPDSMVRESDVIETGAKIIHTHPLDSFIGKLRHLYMLYRILKNGKFDVFQTNIDLFNGPNLFVAWLARIPVRCCHSHNTQQQKEIVQGKTLSISLYQSLMRWMCWHFSNRRCGCSEDAMEFLYKNHNWHQDSYPSVIYNGIDLEKFQKAVDTLSKQKSLGFQARYHILTVGQIIPQKNPLFICDIFREICKKRSDIDLIWVGVGKMKDEVEKKLTEDGTIKKTHFLGRRSDVADIMHCCDAFLLPSVFEGLGIVLIEAQAAGLQCLASDSVPPLADCGAITFLSLHESASTWANTIIKIINKEINKNINNNTLQLFSINSMVEQMEIVFD